MNLFKFHVRRILGLPVHYYFKRAGVPAATHLPILIGLGRLLPIRSVLEFGAGSFSTLTFLDHGLFPHLERILSFETDPDWKRRVEAQVGGDKRLTLELIDPDVPRIAATCDYGAFDLVFVDNGPFRAETIKEVTAHAREWKLAVIHDFENLPYQLAASAAKTRFCFDAYCPHTAVFWNEGRLGKDIRPSLKMMNKAFAQHVKTLEADDARGWSKIVNEVVGQPVS